MVKFLIINKECKMTLNDFVEKLNSIEIVYEDIEEFFDFNSNEIRQFNKFFKDLLSLFRYYYTSEPIISLSGEVAYSKYEVLDKSRIFLDNSVLSFGNIAFRLSK